MAKFQAKDIRNVVLCGHGGTGKTTLTDKLLNFTGAAPNHGSVDQGTSFCDFDEEEKTHKYTIESAVTNFVYKDHLFNFIDCPEENIHVPSGCEEDEEKAAADYEAELAKQGLTVAELRKNIERQMLGQRVLGAEVGRRTVVTPKEIEKYYNEHKDTMYDRRGLHMGIIIYNPAAPADKLAAQLKRGEIDFASTCTKYSIHPSRAKGGDTGPVEWERLNNEMSERLMKMKPGTVSDVFYVQDAQHKRNFKAQVYLFRPGGGEYKLMTLQEATPLITDILRQPKSKDRFEDYSNQLKKKALIDIRL